MRKNTIMKKVYVLMGGCIDDKHVLGVFSSMKKATEAVEWLIKVDTYYKYNPDDLEIETYELNGERVE